MQNPKLHKWSGWPGAYCLDCGADDMAEYCIGIGCEHCFVDCPDGPCKKCCETGVIPNAYYCPIHTQGPCEPGK